MDGDSSADYPISLNSSLKVVPDETRNFFYWLILSIAIAAVIGNMLAIKSISTRKGKFLQKTCIVSLALADIFSVLIFSLNHLEMLTNELIVWTLGEKLCYFIPMGQVFGTTAGSMALLVIALDRYQHVIKTMSTKWDPQPGTCILIALIMTIISTVISYPMFTFYNYEPIKILYYGPQSKVPVYEVAHICVAVVKSRLVVYYLVMTGLIFFPLFATFIWFYFKIAVLIWEHRKPLSSRFMNSKIEGEDASGSSTKTTSLNFKVGKPADHVIKKVKSVQVKKKTRTFRIVIFLMISFTACRFPYWCYSVISVTCNMKSKSAWNLRFALTAVNLLDCVLNPLLYTFLSQSVNVIKMTNDFMCKICCCWCSNDEFVDFEKENPFERKKMDGKDGKVCYIKAADAHVISSDVKKF